MSDAIYMDIISLACLRKQASAPKPLWAFCSGNTKGEAEEHFVHLLQASSD